MNVLEKLNRKEQPLISCVVRDEFIEASEISFDCIFDGTSKFYPWELPTSLPKEFKIGVIVGGSGTGKSTLLKEFGTEENPIWDNNLSILSHFDNPQDGIDKLGSVGFNTVPSWYKPYNVLSNGEKFRADLARKINSNSVIDEYTSVVDRNVARAASMALSKYVKKNDITNVVISTCHRDVIDWLEPDWVIDTDTGELLDGFFFVRPEIKIELYKTTYNHWGMFKDHHYLDGSINKASRCYVAVWGDEVVGFISTMTLPSGSLKNAWRGHRIVILPQFQGMGIGPRLSDTIAQMHIDEGHRFFSRTAHEKLGQYRENSVFWVGTSKNKKLRKDIKHVNVFNNHYADNKRICYSHEYIGIKKEV